MHHMLPKRMSVDESGSYGVLWFTLTCQACSCIEKLQPQASLFLREACALSLTLSHCLCPVVTRSEWVGSSEYHTELAHLYEGGSRRWPFRTSALESLSSLCTEQSTSWMPPEYCVVGMASSRPRCAGRTESQYTTHRCHVHTRKQQLTQTTPVGLPRKAWRWTWWECVWSSCAEQVIEQPACTKAHTHIIGPPWVTKGFQCS